ncbi:MAG: hypothetical protein GY879_08880 [Planctomycetes bacterium]|nr:hypothetical protein [Planctomycetota bacterium]MCP4861169.1 hypothetical protein [Planctomycetota bacterium]
MMCFSDRELFAKVRINSPGGEYSGHLLNFILEDVVGGFGRFGFQQKPKLSGVAHFKCAYTFYLAEISTQVWIRVVIDSRQDLYQGVIHPSYLYLSKSNF